MPQPEQFPELAPGLRTTYAVWEITLKCNLKCIHCGSRAGDARPNELSTVEALDLVHQLADVGIKEVSLIGGEAFLRPDWLEIGREIRRCGMRLTMQTGGFGVGPKMAAKMAEAGFTAVGVSIDGLRKTHNLLRGRDQSHQWCFEAIEAIRGAGMKVSVNTQINRLSAPQLPQIYNLIREAKVHSWQIQFTVPMGNAADNTELLLQPWELLDVFPLLNHLSERGASGDQLYIYPANNVGYYGPYERKMCFAKGYDRNQAMAFWTGSMGGVLTLGIEADGTIKADPSLPTDDWSGGNIRDKSLRDILHNSPQLTFNDQLGTDHLWGFCRGCEFAGVCRGGDTWTSHVYFDRDGNNPICHHRALHHEARGVRERLVMRKTAEGVPFDNGEFDVEIHDADAAPVNADPEGFRLADVDWPKQWLEAEPELAERLADERDRSVEAWKLTRLRVPKRTA